jgi:hypothetical protein
VLLVVGSCKKRWEPSEGGSVVVDTEGSDSSWEVHSLLEGDRDVALPCLGSRMAFQDQGSLGQGREASPSPLQVSLG